MPSITSLSALLFTAVTVSAFSATAKDNVAVYWGQGGTAANPQVDLSSVCSDPSIDIVLIAFVNVFPDQGPGGYPGTNFGNQCSGTTYQNANGEDTALLNSCPGIEPGIAVCHAKDKKVLLSLGGATPNNQFLKDSTSAQNFADFLWGAFGPVQAAWTAAGKPRPFGNAFVDGFDFDIESSFPNGVSNVANPESFGYNFMIDRLRANYAGAEFYISGAPQCVISDAHLAPAIAASHFDFLFVQLYNTPECSARADVSGSTTFPLSDWADRQRVPSKNPNVKVYMGLPAAPGASGDPTFYLTPDEVHSLTTKYLPTIPQFGGIVLWEATFSANNLICSHNYNFWMKAALLASGSGSAFSSSCSTSSSSSSSTSSTSSSTSSSRSSSSSTTSSRSSSVSSTSSSTVSSSSSSSSSRSSSSASSTSSPAVSSSSTSSSTSSSRSSSSASSTSSPAVSTSSSSSSSSSTSSSRSSSASSTSSSSTTSSRASSTLSTLSSTSTSSSSTLSRSSSSSSPTASSSSTSKMLSSSSSTFSWPSVLYGNYSTTTSSYRSVYVDPTVTYSTSLYYSPSFMPSSRTDYASSSSRTSSKPTITSTISSRDNVVHTVITSVVTTAYVDICPTGLTTISTTYTTTYNPSSIAPAIPSGWTSAVSVCGNCGPRTVTLTLTRPIFGVRTKSMSSSSYSSTVQAVSTLLVVPVPAQSPSSSAMAAGNPSSSASTSSSATSMYPIKPVVLVSSTAVTPVTTTVYAHGSGTTTGSASRSSSAMASQFTGAGMRFNVGGNVGVGIAAGMILALVL